MLSSYICTEENWGNVNSLKKSDRYTASLLAYASAIYSDLHDKSAITGCFFDHRLFRRAPRHWSSCKHVQVTRNGARIVGIVAVASIRISVKGKILRVPHTEIRRSLKVSEYPLRGHHMFILRIAHRPSQAALRSRQCSSVYTSINR